MVTYKTGITGNGTKPGKRMRPMLEERLHAFLFVNMQ